MWYQDEDQFVRAPTPTAFDRLVAKLENSDSVLFQSVSLPAASLRASTLSSTGADSLCMSDFIDTDSEVDETEDLKRRIADALARNECKDQMIRERDEKIAQLQVQVAHLQDQAEPDDPELVQFYRSQWESAQVQYDKLREALAAGDHPFAASKRRPPERRQ
jgi:hypothetical protein